MRTTTFEANCIIENDPAAIEMAHTVIEKRYPGCTIERVLDKARQTQGIDYIAHTRRGPINIDVKIRKGCERYWGDGHHQDVMIEYKQGSSNVGWGTNTKLKTDMVLFLFPFGSKSTYKRRSWARALWLPHEFVTNFVNKHKDDCKKRKGWNGYAYSYCIIPTIKQLQNCWKNMAYKMSPKLLPT